VAAVYDRLLGKFTTAADSNGTADGHRPPLHALKWHSSFHFLQSLKALGFNRLGSTAREVFWSEKEHAETLN
jgi:hypothetical protein